MRTLVVHTGGIGDFLLTCPALARIANESRITLAGNPDRIQLAVLGSIANDVYSLDQIRFESLFSEPAPELRAILRRFQRILVWMRDDDDHIRTALAALTSARIDIFPGLPPRSWTRHASEYYAECLGLEDVPEFRIELDSAPGSHDIIIHPGSGGLEKNWPLEHFTALANELAQRGRRVTWCLGPAELERGVDVASKSTLRCDSLGDLARTLAGATTYIGNDSGITHLAAAVGTRTMALFGHTSPEVWAPIGRHVAIFHNAHQDPPSTIDSILALVAPE